MKPPRLLHPLTGLLVTAVLSGFSSLRADVKMPAIFGDHMVLQQGAKLPVWGCASPGEAVTVAIGNDTAKTVAGADGKWRVELAPLPVGGKALTLAVTGKNTLTFQDVLVGDVWICSGQSNMDFGVIMADHWKDEIAKADNPDIRLFFVTRSAVLTPQEDIAGAPPGYLWGTWQVCSPDTLRRAGNWNGFSAVGYFFARDIQQLTRQPVGMIQGTWGGTPAQAWTSLAALQGNPALQHFAESLAKLTPAQTAGFPVVWADYVAAMNKWASAGGPAADKAALVAWQTSVAQAKASGQPASPKPQLTRPRDPGNIGTPATLFNGMINPLIPYAIKGVIWYQGESNEGGAAEYATLFPTMITDWRSHWGQGDFPFLFVQVAGYSGTADPNIGNWPVLRESQAKALSLPNTGMATAIDIGDPNNIHPKDKMDVGARLALVAGHVAYGRSLVHAGPTFDSIKVEGNKIRISYTNTGGGLLMGTPPWTPGGKPPVPPSVLTGFEIAGTDRNWAPAQALVDGQTVVVTSDRVTAPVAVRYDWAASPAGNLYNKEGLPAYPFRTKNSP